MKPTMKRQLSLLVIALMVLSPMAWAPSHPVFTDEDGQTIDDVLGNNWADPGTLPDSFLWKVDIWWEGVTNVPPDEQLRERLAEAHIELTAGNIDAAQDAIAAAQPEMQAVEQGVEALEGNADNFDDYVEHTEEAVSFGEQVDALTYDLEQAVAVGIVAADSPVADAIDNLQDAATEVQDVVADLRDGIVDDIAKDQDVTHIEAENTLEDREEAAGVAAVHEAEVRDELDDAQEELNQLEQHIDTTTAAGGTVDTATAHLFYEASLRLEHAEEAVADESWGEAFGQLTAAEHLAGNAQNHLEGEPLPPELDPTAVQTERQEDNQQFELELEADPALLTANPELSDNLEQTQQEALVDERVDVLLQEGQPAVEVYDAATQEITKFVYSEEPFTPPGIVVEGGKATTEGGFVEGFTYVDSASGIQYTFTDDGWDYQTSFGIPHEEDFPEGFTIPDAFATGTEQHSYTTPDGNTYTYSAVGYSISKPDGTTESFAYDLGKYALPDGGKLEIDPIGYSFFNERGREDARMEYVPEFGTYVSAKDGTVFRMHSIHEEAIQYDYDTHNYVFDPARAAQFLGEQYSQYAGFAPEGAGGPGGSSGPGGPGRGGLVSHDEWTYEPVANTWTNEKTGEVHAAQVAMIAPIGHEDTGSYSTATGETWSYDTATGAWTSGKGEQFISEGGKVTGAYHDISGKTYEYGHEGTYTDSSTGVAWSYDASSHAWTSESGTTGTSTGTAPGGTAGSVAPSTGTAVDAQGNVWSYDQGTATWSSPTFTAPTEGHTGVAPGGYTAPPAGTDTGGHTGTAPSGYSAPSDGGSAPSGGGYSAPSDGGGGTGGSAPSGGDSGGGGHSDGGGGGMGGYSVSSQSQNAITGNVVRKLAPAQEVSPVTKWLAKYLGLDKK